MKKPTWTYGQHPNPTDWHQAATILKAQAPTTKKGTHDPKPPTK